MNPEPLVKAIIDLAQAQLKLGALMTRALLGMQNGPANVPNRPASTAATDDDVVERAAAAIQREMLKHKDVGFASVLRTNFPPDEIRRIAWAALDAANEDGTKV